jgi:hypothetical protein
MNAQAAIDRHRAHACSCYRGFPPEPCDVEEMRLQEKEMRG